MNIFFLTSFIPFLILFAMACEVFFRFRKNSLHRATAYILFSISFLFLSDYNLQFLPLEEAELFLLIFKYCNAFIVMGLAIYYFRRMLNLEVTRFWYVISILPLTGVVMIISEPSVFYNEVIQIGAKRAASISTPLLMALLLATIYSFIWMINSFIKAYKKAYQDLSSELIIKRIRFLIKHGIWTLLIISTLFVLDLILNEYGTILSYLFPFGAAYFAFIIRYAMVQFDFLATSNHKYKLLFKISSNGIILIDNSFQIKEVNPAFCKMIGRDEEDIIHRSFLSLLTEHGYDSYAKNVKGAFLTLKPLNEEYYLKLEDGRKLIVEIKSDYIEIEDKKHAYLLLRDITKQKENDNKLQYLAYHDPLTGLGNRRLFYERYNELVKSNYSILAVALVDLNDFKSINDQFGHAIGDKVIQHVANQIVGSIPEDAHASRMGGDEFAILIPANDDQQFDKFVNSIAANLTDSLFLIEGHSIYISGSIGISIASSKGEDVDELLKFADASMYNTKNKAK